MKFLCYNKYRSKIISLWLKQDSAVDVTFMLFEFYLNDQMLSSVPGQPNPPTSSSSTTSTITLQWDDIPGLALKTYTVIQDGDDIITGINTNMVTVDNLTSNANYEFQVKANNSAGHGQASNTSMFATSKLLVTGYVF